MDISVMEVDFGSFCQSCRYSDNAENESPCNVCLALPAREGTKVPLKYEKVVKSYRKSQKIKSI